MGQTQGKDEDNSNNNNAVSPRKDKKDKKKKEKKVKPLTDQLAFKMLVGGIGATMQMSKAVDKVADSLDPDNWKKKPKLLHDGHFELVGKSKSSVNTETSLGLFYCLPNELLAHLSAFLSWKEALSLQASSRGLFLLLEDDLYWEGLYDKVDWKYSFADTGAPVIEIPNTKPLPNELEECCYKKKFFKRYLMPEEKKARTQAQINTLHSRIQQLEAARVAKTSVHDREYNRQKKNMDNRRLTVAFAICILLALFLKPLSIFLVKLTIFTFQMPAELFISFIERFSCWRGLPVTCWGFNSRKTFDSLSLVMDAGVRDDYLFCTPTVTMACAMAYIFWAFFQLGKLVSTCISLAVISKIFLGGTERCSYYLLQFKAFSQKELKERYDRKIEEINGYYNPKISKLQNEIETLRRSIRSETTSNTRSNSLCCVQ